MQARQFFPQTYFNLWQNREGNRHLNYILASSDLEIFRFPASMTSFNDYITQNELINNDLQIISL